MAMQPKCVQNGYLTAAVLGVPNAQRGNTVRKWLCRPNRDEVATSPLLSGGTTTLSISTHIGNACAAHGGQRGYVTPAISGVPKARRGEKNHKWPCGPHVDKMATSPPPSRESLTLSTRRKAEMAMRPIVGTVGTSATLPIPSERSLMLTHGRKNRNGCVAHNGQRGIHHRCHFGGPQRSAQGGKAKWLCKMAMQAKFGQNGYITHAICDPQHSARAEKSEPAKWSTSGQTGYTTHAI